MISTRIKLILLILLNTAIILLPAQFYFAFMLIIFISSLAFYKSFLVNFKIIFVYLVSLFLITILLNYLLGESELLGIIPGFLKVFAIISISILLITDLNIMELVASISFIKIPAKIAIAFGVGFRYFSLLLTDIKRIHFIQTSKGYGLNLKSFRSNGFISTVGVFLTPLFLSILKRADNIALSITIQQIEQRATSYIFKRISLYEWLLILSSVLFLIYCLILKFNLYKYSPFAFK